MSGWNSSEGYEVMQRYQSAEAHAFQPFQTSLQEHVGSVGIPEFFQALLGSPIPPPRPLSIDMLSLKRKATEEIRDEDEDVQIVAPPALKKKGAATAKKPRKENVKKEKVEEGEESGSKNWKDHDVETMISLRGEMEPEFLKNIKKQGNVLCLFAFAFAGARPPFPPIPPIPFI